MRKRVAPHERVLRRVEYRGDCWIYTGSLSKDGYGRVSRYDADGNLGHTGTHRAVYEALVGPIPAGLTLDHLCRVRSCVNPAHLEPVDGHENMLRGTSKPAINARKTHCDYGHEYTPENTVRDPKTGYRRCRACRQKNSLEQRLKDAKDELAQERAAHLATKAALDELQQAARNVLDDYFGNVADGGESPERSYLRALAAGCEYDFEARWNEL